MWTKKGGILQMRGSNAVKFFSVLVIIGILTWIVAFGSIFGIEVPGAATDIVTGIDIRGGVDAKLYAITDDGKVPTKDELESAKLVIAKRLDAKNILDRVITTDPEKGYILVQIPHKKGEEFDPQKSIEDIGKTALLTFREVDESKKDDKGDYLPIDKIVLEGTDVKDAQPGLSQNGGYEVSLTLSSEGAKKFAEATGNLIGKPIAIFLDEEFISAPIVQSRIDGGNASITLGGTKSDEQRLEAQNLAGLIRSGALPFKLEAKQINNISPTLGTSALSVCVNAFIVAFVLVCLFMLFYYRLPGLLACVALLLHTVLQLLVISWMGITVTLPGIAGIILTVGMGVDANVIIFERIKEEIKSGKTLRAAIDVGFKRAFAAVLDANMTTLIAALVLWFFGSGAIQSFAYTLGIGVALSFITAVTASRIMLKSVADLDIAKHHWLYGVSTKANAKEVTNG